MKKQKKGKLYLIPTPLAENSLEQVVTAELKNTIEKLTFYLVENIRAARRFISSLKLNLNIESLNFEILDKDTSVLEIERLCQPLITGTDIGMMSEAGCPGIADPGSLAVSFAHQNDIEVVPLVGPSSILMALMGSGFNGQSFVFHGYLPIDKLGRSKRIKSMEKDAVSKKQTQIFMETPYRNNKLLDDLIKNCQIHTKLCIAKNVTGATEMIKTQTIKDWKKTRPDLHKVPAIFLIYCE